MRRQHRSRATIGRAAGVEAMLGMTALMVVLRFTLQIPTLPELFSDTILYLIPAPLFSATLDLLRFDAKYLLLLILFAGQIGIGALSGWYLATTQMTLRVMRFRLLLGPSILFAGLAWLATILALMPLLGAGFMGADSPAGAPVTMLGYAFAYLTFAISFSWLFPLHDRRPMQTIRGTLISRRTVLKQLATGILGIIAAAVGLKLVSGLLPQNAGHLSEIPPPVTPVSDFYVVSKNLIGVQVDLSRWGLDLIGTGGKVARLSLTDVKALPSIELTSTLTCISNLVGGNLIGTARWTGVRLSDLIGTPSLSEPVTAVVFTGWDDYSDSIPIAKALDPRTIVVYEMDGQPLPSEHGFPVRIIVPGLYGIKNVKWVKRIEVVGHGFVGYWQSRGWSDTAVVQTQSQIDVPADRAIVPLGTVPVGGIAFAGTRGIAKVELSVDGGESWFPASLQPPASPYAWSPWTTTWSPGAPGRYTLVVRATDTTGQLQPVADTPPIPDGATGFHRIGVRVT